MIYVYPMYGLGGRIWSWAVEDYVAAGLRTLHGMKVAPTRSYTLWREIVEEIRNQPKGSKTVVIGHSMGAGSATYVTDYVKVDLVVCYDCAGRVPSYIGGNTGKLLDFRDLAFALVPKYRPKAIRGHSHKIVVTETRDGHTGQPFSPKLLKIVKAEIENLKGKPA